jgi:hypothetical protein
MYLLFKWRRTELILKRATSIARAIERGRALKIETFLGNEMATSEAKA